MERLAYGFALLLTLAGGQAKAGVITFDTHADGTPLHAPALFFGGSPLTDLYASLGVHFSGPTPTTGGEILDEGANFGITARSGRNFLAFNSGADTGYAIDPETIRFDSAVSEVSIYAATGSQPVGTITMSAYDASGTLLATSSVTTQTGVWSLLSVSSAAGITRVVIDSDRPVGVFDDLSFTPAVGGPSAVPEPASMSLLALGAAGMIGHRLWRRKAGTEPTGVA